MFGVYIFITQYLQLVLGLSPLRAGLATLPWALAFILGSLLAPRLARSLSRLSVMVWGLAAAALGMALVAAVGSSVGSAMAGLGLPMLIVGTVVMSLGMSPVFTIGNEMIITAAPPERAGSASALSETASEFSGAVGIALFGSAGTVVYRHGLTEAMPAGVPEAAADAALGTIGGAVAVAHSLPVAAGDALRAAARAAFVDALQLSALAGAAIVVLACLLSARLLRDGRPAARSTASPR
jgi:DHA2 family multidrug resistance protein-like MFS transporter